MLLVFSLIENREVDIVASDVLIFENSKNPFYFARCEMIRTKNLTIPKMDEVRNEVLQTIISHLGITKAAFFLRESMSKKVDYLQIKEGLFGKKTAKDIYREMKSK